jgi:uncharacterized protein YicC (UPF0701 family)
MARLTWVGALAATAVLTIGAAACGGGGGDGEQLTAQEYATELNAICEDFNTKVKHAVDNFRHDRDRLGRAELDAHDDAIAEVEALEPPDELADTADEFIATRNELRENLVQTIDLGAEGDEAEATALTEQGAALWTQKTDLARELGAGACTQY